MQRGKSVAWILEGQLVTLLRTTQGYSGVPKLSGHPPYSQQK